MHAQIQVAGRAAVRAGLPFAGGAHARAVLDPDRDPHVDAARVAALLDGDAARRAVIRLLEARGAQLGSVSSASQFVSARRRPTAPGAFQLSSRTAVLSGGPR